ncbi:phosphatidylethanolamine-binding protein [Micromonospora sp. WMMD1102]|uniref:phosphatidylethanolamine-binding protein n=1 Tax=Micromonospora sp. WMMD1102 TaxID=3016105 RepID=UPI0024156B36|nr:phosphatidylethanolamine-binding protein [Micromonospora sp. WMMD1102]MDG4787003.1 phosphatidylethanolamine-binding protein [Micromonospora sp. WMMD1102]
MPGPRPGSNAYDVERARLRKHIDDSGRRANDSKADDTANRYLREDRGRPGFVRGERGLGPKGERGPGEPK